MIHLFNFYFRISEDFEIAKDIPHWQNETELPIKDFNEKIAYNEKRKKLSKYVFSFICWR